MTLQDALKDKRSVIVQKWFEAALATYHEDARGPMRRTRAQFTNPVGFNIAQGLEGLFDALMQGVISDTVSTFLDAIVRVRAVQDFAPSEALAFLLRIKQIVREELGRELSSDRGMAEDLAKFDGVADDLMLYAFDLYMGCREKIYDLKAQESRNMTFRLLQKVQGKPENQE